MGKEGQRLYRVAIRADEPDANGDVFPRDQLEKMGFEVLKNGDVFAPESMIPKSELQKMVDAGKVSFGISGIVRKSHFDKNGIRVIDEMEMTSVGISVKGGGTDHVENIPDENSERNLDSND